MQEEATKLLGLCYSKVQQGTWASGLHWFPCLSKFHRRSPKQPRWTLHKQRVCAKAEESRSRETRIFKVGCKQISLTFALERNLTFNILDSQQTCPLLFREPYLSYKVICSTNILINIIPPRTRIVSASAH